MAEATEDHCLLEQARDQFTTITKGYAEWQIELLLKHPRLSGGGFEFVRSLREHMERKGELSPKQHKKLGETFRSYYPKG